VTVLRTGEGVGGRCGADVVAVEEQGLTFVAGAGHAHGSAGNCAPRSVQRREPPRISIPTAQTCNRCRGCRDDFSRHDTPVVPYADDRAEVTPTVVAKRRCFRPIGCARNDRRVDVNSGATQAPFRVVRACAVGRPISGNRLMIFITQKERLNRKEHKERKGVQCLASMTLFTLGVNIVRIGISCFPSRPFHLCGSKCRI
jgi:hypothetical protein